MYENLRQCIKSEYRYEGKINSAAMTEHLLSQKLLCCCNKQLRFYNEIEGRYITLEPQTEWHLLGYFFSDRIRKIVPPSVINDIIMRLKYMPEIQADINSFNNHSDLINIKNGVYEVSTGILHEKNPAFRFTYQLNVSYKKDVSEKDMENFLMFCQTSLDGNEQKKELLLQMIGYLCTTLMEAKKCCLLIGEPDSGKSLVLHLIEYMIGEEYISNISLEHLGDRFASAVLSTKLLNSSAELSAMPLKNIEMFKLIVGGDTLNGEYKGKPIFCFKNRCKLLYAGNMLPPIKNEDISTAFINRLTVLRFTHSIPKKERIHDLEAKLKKETDAIFTYSMEALRRLIEDNYTFAEPEDSKILLTDYSFQQTNIDIFVKEWCKVGENLKIHSARLYSAYREFCTENAVSAVSQNLFSQKIGSITGVSSGRFRINGSNSARGFYGIDLVPYDWQDSET